MKVSFYTRDGIEYFRSKEIGGIYNCVSVAEEVGCDIDQSSRTLAYLSEIGVLQRGEIKRTPGAKRSVTQYVYSGIPSDLNEIREGKPRPRKHRDPLPIPPSATSMSLCEFLLQLASEVPPGEPLREMTAGEIDHALRDACKRVTPH